MWLTSSWKFGGARQNRPGQSRGDSSNNPVAS
jgi:hypothetical protein